MKESLLNKLEALCARHEEIAGLLSDIEIINDQNRFRSLSMEYAQLEELVTNFTAGFGFMGIAVALMGRNHPIGVLFAALLFGVLYQGGTELAFEIPTFTSDMVVVIQGLVILFCGALENIFRNPIKRLFQKRKRVSRLRSEGSA